MKSHNHTNIELELSGLVLKEVDIIDSPDLTDIKNLLSEYLAITYPKHILKRRISLLTKNERIRFEKLWCGIIDKLEKMDALISIRAEKERDEWE